jgi:hypothetical protein
MDEKRHGIDCSWKSWLFILSIIVCVGLCMPFVSQRRFDRIIKLSATTSQDINEPKKPAENKREDANSSRPPPPPPPANSSVNPLAQEAVKLGVLSCISRINQVANFLTANTQSGVFIFPPGAQPDQHVFSTSFELIRPDNSTIYSSASFFPNQDAVYDTVEYVNTSSEELEKTIFKNLKRVGVVKKNIVLLDGGAVKVFLMPAGSGCVVIKKEVVR